MTTFCRKDTRFHLEDHSVCFQSHQSCFQKCPILFEKCSIWLETGIYSLIGRMFRCLMKKSLTMEGAQIYGQFWYRHFRWVTCLPCKRPEQHLAKYREKNQSTVDITNRNLWNQDDQMQKMNAAKWLDITSVGLGEDEVRRNSKNYQTEQYQQATAKIPIQSVVGQNWAIGKCQRWRLTRTKIKKVRRGGGEW